MAGCLLLVTSPMCIHDISGRTNLRGCHSKSPVGIQASLSEPWPVQVHMQAVHFTANPGGFDYRKWQAKVQC